VKLTMLITCVGGELAPEILRGLRASERYEIKLVGVDMATDAVGRNFCDHFEVVPRGDDPAYPEAILTLTDRHGVDLVYPTSDEEAVSLAAIEDDLKARGVRLAANSHEFVSLVSDKIATYKRLDEVGIATPTWVAVDSRAELPGAVEELMSRTGSAVVKPARARGSRGVYVLEPESAGATQYQGSRETHIGAGVFLAEHADEVDELYPLLVMERLVEPVFDVDMLSWHGVPKRVVARRRVHSARPNEGHMIVVHEVLQNIGRSIITGLGSSWLLDCDIMHDAQGAPQILEINPRPSGSLAVPIRAGVPLLDDMISLAYGEPLAETGELEDRLVVPYKALAVVPCSE
jgi:carbamoylphosphate synthase large subunit